MKRNVHLEKLHSGYIFPEINKRKKLFLEQNPHAELISLGIGDTTEPISPHITAGLKKAAEALGTREGYTGYGPEQGNLQLRQKIADVLYQSKFTTDEIFISDGSKCDIGRLQLLFGSQTIMAVQDPSYPAFVDTSVMVGQTSKYSQETAQYPGIVYMPCQPENDFFPDLEKTPRADIIFFCSPNNPTGATATRQQLEELVQFAKKNKSILIFDGAYASYIQDPTIPKSIYEIPGAREVAIELGSFSKMAGFTGVRLGWSLVPKELKYEDGSSVQKDWHRIISTFFNGASNIAQMGGIAALEEQGLQEMQKMTTFYLENTLIIKNAIEKLGLPNYGGTNTPYLWVKFPGMKSWDAFEKVLHETQIVSTPGIGFGPGGEGFLRFSAFGSRPTIQEAAKRWGSALRDAYID